MAKFRMKPMIVEALTFDELVQYGLTQTDNVYNNMPWSFTYMGIPVTHETDDCYILGGDIRFTPNQLLVVKDHEISVVEADAFELISELIEDNKKEN